MSCELCGFEACESLPRSGGVPGVTAGGDRTELFVVSRRMDLLEDSLSRHDLVGAHDEKLAVDVEHTVPRQDGKQGVFSEEGGGEGNEVGYPAVFSVSPPAGELEAVRRGSLPSAFGVLGEMCVAGGVRVVLGECAVADHKQLHVLEEA